MCATHEYINIVESHNLPPIDYCNCMCGQRTNKWEIMYFTNQCSLKLMVFLTSDPI